MITSYVRSEVQLIDMFTKVISKGQFLPIYSKLGTENFCSPLHREC